MSIKEFPYLTDSAFVDNGEKFERKLENHLRAYVGNPQALDLLDKLLALHMGKIEKLSEIVVFLVS